MLILTGGGSEEVTNVVFGDGNYPIQIGEQTGTATVSGGIGCTYNGKIPDDRYLVTTFGDESIATDKCAAIKINEIIDNRIRDLSFTYSSGYDYVEVEIVYNDSIGKDSDSQVSTYAIDLGIKNLKYSIADVKQTSSISTQRVACDIHIQGVMTLAELTAAGYTVSHIVDDSTSGG